MNLMYEWDAAKEVVRKFHQLPAKKRGHLLQIFDQIAYNFHLKPDYIRRAADGSKQYVVAIDSWVLVYHLDHAVKTVNILDVLER